MRQEFLNRLRVLLLERRSGSWKDGWVYGRLKQEFDLQPDELDAMATALGFKYKWNPGLKFVLEEQWQKEEPHWMAQELKKLERQVFLNQEKDDLSSKIAALLQDLETSNGLREELTDVERALVSLILKMKQDEQIWLLESIFNRYKSKP